MQIKINLLGERKKKGSATFLWLALYGASLAVMFFTFLLLYRGVAADLSEKESQISLLDAQLKKLKVVTKEVRELAAKKQTLSEKIAVMAALRKKKAGPVRVMDDLNLSIPDRSWITDVKEAEGGLLKISGFALDYETISTFLKSLDNSEFFSNVDLVDSKKAVVKGITITEFLIQSKVNYLGQLVPEAAPIQIQPSAEAKAKE